MSELGGQMGGIIPKALNPFKKSKGYKKSDVADAVAAQIAAQAANPPMDPNRVLLLGLAGVGALLLLTGKRR